MDLKEFGFTEINYQLLDAVKTPYKIYAELLDEGAQQQFLDVLSAPFVTYAALMPDAHQGYTMPIGGVCATKDVIVPQFVGFDIGCGMCAFKTNFSREQIENKAQIIYNKIIENIPLGFKTHKNAQSFKSDLPRTDFAQYILESSALKQLGTLGGGNHFIEIGYGKDESVWIIVHSGSRGLGHKIASHYMLQAFLEQNPQDKKLTEIVAEFEERNIKFKELRPEKYQSSLNKFTVKQKAALIKKAKIDNIKGIWGLDTNSELGKEYILDQNFALNYALENRKRMIIAVHNIFNNVLNSENEIDFNCNDFINRNHNHAEFDDKSNQWIHRKGATHAEKGMRGVIPGNMRDGCFIVTGKGNYDSLQSSSHGAGRVMSRTKAKKNVSIEDFESSMKNITGTVDINTVDESPFAYKDIFEVMNLQKDLVSIDDHIKVLINVKDNAKSRF